MKIIAFCPIKLNNERLKDKNIKTLGDKPLIQHSLNTVIESKIFDKVYVYCSSTKIKKYLPDGCTFLERPSSLDSRDTKGKDIYKLFGNNIEADYYFLFHVTSPFLTLNSIQAAVNSLKNGYDSALSVSKHNTFARYDDRPVNFDPKDPIQTQLLKPIYLETSSFYLFSEKEIRKGVRYGENCKLIVVDEKESIDIDNLEDWEKAEKYLNI